MLLVFVLASWTIARMAYIMCPPLSSATLLGVGWWGGSSCREYLLLPAWLVFHTGIFIFKRCVVRYLGYFFLWLLIRLYSRQLEVQCALHVHAVLVVSLWLFCLQCFWRYLQICLRSLWVLSLRSELEVPSLYSLQSLLKLHLYPCSAWCITSRLGS